MLLAVVLLITRSSLSQSALTYNAAVPNYVQVSNAMNTLLAGTNQITAEGWCFLTAYPFLPTVVGNYGPAGMQFLLRVDGNKPAFWVDNGGGFNVINGATTIPLNTWTHLAGVWDGSALRVYINGVLDGTNPGVSGAFPTMVNPVRIGANQTSEAWTGKLDAVRIWKAARTVTEINTTMNSCLTGTETNLLALYNFEEGSGTTVADLTGHGYNGTLVSAPAWTSGFGCAALPVTFLSINAKGNSNSVSITWKVATEQGTRQYDIERSPDGLAFNKYGTIAATGKSTYSWTDANPLSTVSFYRVKSIDESGLIKYTRIVSVAPGNNRAGIAAWPNPVENRELHLQLTNQLAGRYDINLADAAGRLVFLSTLQFLEGNTIETIQLPAGIPAGVYHLTIGTAGKTVSAQKLLVK